MSTVAYTVMGAVGFEICWWWHQNIGALLGPVRYSIRDSLVMVVAGILFLLMLQRVLEDFFPSYKKFKSTLASHIGQFGWFGSLWLALISAAGEELLFRGALQPFLGVWLTSILFGLLHLDPDEGLTAWTAWALIAGLILGASCNVTGSLWPALIIHFTINFWGLRSLAKINVQSTKQKPSGIA
jgi:membrane protease YdiL (CAAX protease family)